MASTGRGRFQRANNDIDAHRKLGRLIDQAEGLIIQIADLTSRMRPRVHHTNRLLVRMILDIGAVRNNMDNDLFRADKEVLALVPEMELRQIYYAQGRPAEYQIEEQAQSNHTDQKEGKDEN